MNTACRSITTLKISAIVIFTTFTLSACFDNSEEVDIPLSEVPANVISVVQNTLPGISLSEAEKEIKENTTIYELEGKLINGKKYEIKIDDNGTIIKIKLDD